MGAGKIGDERQRRGEQRQIAFGSPRDLRPIARWAFADGGRAEKEQGLVMDDLQRHAAIYSGRGGTRRRAESKIQF
jgi:hypothetical protein